MAGEIWQNLDKKEAPSPSLYIGAVQDFSDFGGHFMRQNQVVKEFCEKNAILIDNVNLILLRRVQFIESSNFGGPYE